MKDSFSTEKRDAAASLELKGCSYYPYAHVRHTNTPS